MALWGSCKGQKEIVEILILEGADLDAQDNKGETALKLADCFSSSSSSSFS
jgi:ankyrin repeat protein